MVNRRTTRRAVAAALLAAVAGCQRSGDGDGTGPPATPPAASGPAAVIPPGGPGPGWTANPHETWTAVGETIYDRINGAAEVYLQYDFKAGARAQFVRDGTAGVYLEVTVYEFGSSAEAFGAYTTTSDLPGTPAADLGDAAVVVDGTLVVWRGVYLVRIVVSEVTEATTAARRQMAEAIVRNIPGDRAVLPDILDLLPAEGRIAGSERYLHTALSMMQVEPGFRTAPLGLGRDTDVVTADYAAEGPPGAVVNRIFVIRYRTAEAAAAARQAYLDDPSATGSRVGQETVLEQHGRYLVGSWRKTAEAAAPVLPKVIQRVDAARSTG